MSVWYHLGKGGATIDSMLTPKIITTLKSKEKNFVFRVHAYRRLSETEMQQALQVWLRTSHRKKIPSNKTVDFKAIHGFDE